MVVALVGGLLGVLPAAADDGNPPQSDRIVVSVGSITTDGAEVSWPDVAGVERYMARWWVSGDRDGTLKYEPVLTNSKTLGGLAEGTTYEVEVVAKVNGAWQKDNKSDPVSFTTAAAGQRQQTPPPPPPTPEVSIAGGAGVTEGGDAVFTLTASPAPEADITINVDVSSGGDYGVSTGTETVTIGTGGTATLTVATSDDGADEADGSVTATLASGSGYTIGTANAATIAVSDNEVPEISIASDGDVTEGAAASFTITASPTPYADITVSVDVSASGDYGVSAGSQTVTIGTGGTATLTVATTGDSVDEPHGSVTAILVFGSGYTVGSASSATVTVSDDDDPPAGYTAPASLVSDVRSYAAETHHGQDHIDRWNRVLEGLCVEEFPGLSAMTSTEAKGYADQGWARWDPVVTELAKAESLGCAQSVGKQQQQQQQQTTPEVSIAGGAGVTEGGDAVFTLTAARSPLLT